MSQELAFPTRRLLVAGLGLGAVGVAAAGPIAKLGWVQSGAAKNASWWDRTFATLNNAGLATWSSLIGETFTLTTANGAHLLRIVGVRPFAQSGARPRSLGRTQAFAVVFEQTAGKPLPGADLTLQLAHRAYPALSIYMGAPVKVGAKDRLIAVFN